MGCLTLALSMLFRLKSHAISSLPKNLSANIFSKTFIVFNPYPEHRRVIHSFLSVLPILVLFACMVFILIVWKIFEYGLALSLIILIICLNLILVEVAPETYQNAKIFVKAFNSKADLGAGDLKVFQVLKRTLPQLSNYYLALSILFLILAATLGYIWSPLLWFFAQVIGSILEVSALTGIIGSQVAVALFALMVTVFQIFILKIKSKFLSNLLGT